mmetsp:Transcript_262/g.339  ORF Transcript_262/g.339 Transcript_262/m.339 type:complete len:408 (+) Transcript_262:87-1310(+)
MLTRRMLLSDLKEILDSELAEKEEFVQIENPEQIKEEKGSRLSTSSIERSDSLKVYLEDIDYCFDPSFPSSKASSFEEIVPVLHELQDADAELKAVARACEAIQDRVASANIRFYKDLLDDSQLETHKQFLNCHEDEHETLSKHFVDEAHKQQETIDSIQAALKMADSSASYIDILKSLPQMFTYRLTTHDHMSQSKLQADTRHQDCRDIERDRIKINGENIYSGASLTYEGTVDLVAEEVARIIQKHVNIDMENEDVKLGLTRFARVLLNSGNRTNSGGDAYEVIMNTLGCTEEPLILITPDSNRADPVELHLSVGVFSNSKLEALDWGVIAELQATTYYNITDPVELETCYGQVKGGFKQTLGLSLPLPEYSSNLSQDDGKSFLNRKDYTIKHDHAGSVTVEVLL